MAKTTIYLKDNHKGGVDFSYQPSIGELLKRVEAGHESHAYQVTLHMAKAAADLAERSRVAPAAGPENPPPASDPDGPPPLADLTADGIRSVMMAVVAEFSRALTGWLMELVSQHGADPDRCAIHAMPGGISRLARKSDDATLLKWDAPRVKADDDGAIVFEWKIYPQPDEVVNGQ